MPVRFRDHLLFGAIVESFAVEKPWWKSGEGLERQGAPRAEQHPSRDSLWPPCLVIYLQLNSDGGRGQVFHLDKKKRALSKEADLSITLFCCHGAFIAFLSTNPFPFLKHNDSPPPLSLSSQETWWFLFIFTDTCTAASPKTL